MAQDLLTIAEMYEADRRAVELGVASLDLMEAAGHAVADAIVRRYPRQAVLVLCGPGNNGGDGFVVARYLSDWGWPVRLALLGEIGSLRGDAAAQAARWTDSIEPLSVEGLNGASLIVDALFGAGLTRPLEGEAAAVAAEVRRRGLTVVAVDVPSGIAGDSGARLGETAFQAALTVTFFRKKPGHLLLPGRLACGETVFAQIGIPESVLEEIRPQTFENGPALWNATLPRRRPESHKYSFGHALVFGGRATTGAARLAARAALRGGAGLVTVAAPAAALPIYAQDCASIMTLPLEASEDCAPLLEDRRRNAFLIGPGAGLSSATREALRERVCACLKTGRATVLDADALSAFEDAQEILARQIEGPTVLTPHKGEFKRLFPSIDGDKLERTRTAAILTGATVILKGYDSVIASPDGRAVINTNAPSTLATAGAGDVLAGICLGLLAQKMPTFEAACCAVWLHGEAARRFGPGLLAEDLPARLPEALHNLPEASI